MHRRTLFQRALVISDGMARTERGKLDDSLQPREYTIRATGWMRTVPGIQSLMSVYLLALWR